MKRKTSSGESLSKIRRKAGRLGGLVRSARKAEASRNNGRKGGRKPKQEN